MYEYIPNFTHKPNNNVQIILLTPQSWKAIIITTMMMMMIIIIIEPQQQSVTYLQLQAIKEILPPLGFHPVSIYMQVQYATL